MATPLSPPIVIEPQTNFWRPLALILLALILLIPWLLDLRLDDLIALWPKTLDSNVAPPPPSQTLTLTKKNQDPSLGLNFLALKAQPESVGPCPKGQGDGEILAAFARPVSFNNLWVYLSYRGAIGTYVTQSELEGPKPVTAVDFAGRFRILGPAKTPLTLGPARSLAVGLHPGFVRVAINYPPDNIPLAALTEVYCFKPKTSFGLNLLAISLTLTPPRRLSDYF
jgi:hypothetical protein